MSAIRSNHRPVARQAVRPARISAGTAVQAMAIGGAFVLGIVIALSLPGVARAAEPPTAADDLFVAAHDGDPHGGRRERRAHQRRWHGPRGRAVDGADLRHRRLERGREPHLHARRHHPVGHVQLSRDGRRRPIDGARGGPGPVSRTTRPTACSPSSPTSSRDRPSRPTLAPSAPTRTVTRLRSAISSPTCPGVGLGSGRAGSPGVRAADRLDGHGHRAVHRPGRDRHLVARRVRGRGGTRRLIRALTSLRPGRQEG